MDRLATDATEGDQAVQVEGFSAVENTGFGLLRLQTFHRESGSRDPLAERLGFALPGPGETVEESGIRVFWSAPGEWILAVAAGSEHEEMRKLEGRLDGLFTVISDSRVVIELDGPRARDVLARGSTVDFHRSTFTAGRCIHTRFAGIPAMIAQPEDREAFLLFADRSLAAYLWDWFGAASVECGVS